MLLLDINLTLDEIKENAKIPLKKMKIITDRYYVKSKEIQELIFED